MQDRAVRFVAALPFSFACTFMQEIDKKSTPR